jgi:cell division protein FtsQ
MPRLNRVPLRGSVTQNTASYRMRPREVTRETFLIRLGILVGSVMAILVVTALLWHSGWPQRQAGNLASAGLYVTQKAHFAVKDIVVEGRKETGKEMLAGAIGVSLGSPIFGFDVTAAQARIAKLPWVETAVVERRLPDVVYVRLIERVPLARWQHENHVTLIDTEGMELPDANPSAFPQLPLVVGSDAAGYASDLLAELKDYPAVAEKMTAAARVGERRWDIYLQPKVVAKLPQDHTDNALRRLSDLITDQQILARDVSSIDLRIPDRLVIEPADAATGHKGGDKQL